MNKEYLQEHDCYFFPIIHSLGPPALCLPQNKQNTCIR